MKYKCELTDFNAVTINRAVSEVVDCFVSPIVAKLEGKEPTEPELLKHGVTFVKPGVGVLATWQFLWKDRPIVEMHAVEEGVEYSLVVEELPPNMPVANWLLSK